MNPLNQHHEEILRDAARQLSRSENLTNICQSQWQGEPLPSHSAVKEIITLCRALIFPGFFGDSTVTRSNITYHTGLWAGRLYTLLCEQIHAGLSLGGCCIYKDAAATAHVAERRCESHLSWRPCGNVYSGNYLLLPRAASHIGLPYSA